jgi:hypothetical protein
MNVKTMRFILIVAGFVLCSSIHAQTIQVSGEIPSDITWQASTVQVTGNVHIARNATVTVLPGTRVEFQGHFEIDVDGAILANGTAVDSIIFTINNPAATLHHQDYLVRAEGRLVARRIQDTFPGQNLR